MAATANGHLVYSVPDAETEVLVAAVRPQLKSLIRQTRTVLAYLTELDQRFDLTHSPKEAQRNGNGSTETHT